MKVWTNNKFTGVWPVGTAAVIVAETKHRAAEYLANAIKAAGLQPAIKSQLIEDMREVKMDDGFVDILRDGEY